MLSSTDDKSHHLCFAQKGHYVFIKIKKYAII